MGKILKIQADCFCLIFYKIIYLLKKCLIGTILDVTFANNKVTHLFQAKKINLKTNSV